MSDNPPRRLTGPIRTSLAGLALLLALTSATTQHLAAQDATPAAAPPVSAAVAKQDAGTPAAKAAPEGIKTESPVIFMRRVADELMVAAKTGDRALFAAALRKYGALDSIGKSALGEYRAKLAKEDQPTYINAMVSWISRYAANKAPTYPVSKTTVVRRGPESRGTVAIDTQVFVEGQPYDVRWHLVRSQGSFKIRDVQVDLLLLGQVSCVEMLGKQFQNFMADNDGNPRILIRALNG